MPELASVPHAVVFRARRATRSLTGFARGYRFGGQLPEASGPHTAEHRPTELETYFDAHTEGPGLWKWRHYFDIYDRHLAKFVGRPVDIVEIGIYSGGSLPMWRSYFGARCTIYGAPGIDVVKVRARKQS